MAHQANEKHVRSAWVSSDLLMTLLYDLNPAQRGLVRMGNSPIWEFPGDYISQLHVRLIEARDETQSVRR